MNYKILLSLLMLLFAATTYGRYDADSNTSDDFFSTLRNMIKGVVKEALPRTKSVKKMRSPSHPIVIPKGAQTNEAFHTSVYNFLAKQLLSPQHEEEDQYSTYVNDVLKHIAGLHPVRSLSQLKQQGDDLFANYRSDPLFCYTYAYALKKSTGNSRSILAKLSRSINQSDTPALTNFLFNALVSKNINGKRKRKRRKKQRQARQTVIYLKELLDTCVITKDHDHILYYLLESQIGNPTTFYNITKNYDLGEWFEAVMEAKMEIKHAWTYRGGGSASSVSKDGWKGFKQHLKQAEGYLTSAWRAYPDRPEAASLMITISMAGAADKGESDELWFNRAVKADADYYPAYTSLLWAQRPRWGGSHKQMHSLGLAALNTKRFDTKIPTIYLRAVLDIAEDIHGYRWRQPFYNQETMKNLRLLFKEMKSRTTTNLEKEKITAMEGLCEMYAGNYKQAKSLIDQTGADVNFTKLLAPYGARPYLRAPFEMIDAELRVGCVHGKKLRTAYNELHRRQKDKAIIAFKEVLKEIDPEDEEARIFLIKEIAYSFMGPRMEALNPNNSPLRWGLRNKKNGITELMAELGVTIDNMDN